LGNFDANRIRPIVSVDYAMVIKKALLIGRADALPTGRAKALGVPRRSVAQQPWPPPITGF
jgi:hypothetical protein